MNKKVLSMALVSSFGIAALASCSRPFELVLPEVNVLSFDEIKDEKVKITFWHPFGKNNETALNKQVDAFKEQYPNIEVEVISKGGYDTLKKAVTMDVQTGNTPDVVLGYPDHFAEYLSAGVMVPLDDYMNSEDPEIGVREGAHNAKDDIFENYMEENKQFYNDLTFGLPFNKSTELAFYNKSFFDEFDLEVPTTWQQVPTLAQDILDIIEENDLYGKVWKGPKTGVEFNFGKVTKNKLRPVCYDSAANAFITLTRDYGGEYTKMGESFQEGVICFDNDGTKEALGMLKDMSDKNQFGLPVHWEDTHCSKYFTQLQSFYSIGSSAGSYYNNPTGDAFELGVAPVPYYDDGTTTRKNVIQQGTNIAMLSNNNDIERMASWLLIRWLTCYHDEENDIDPNAEFAIEASYLPVRKSGVNAQFYQDFLDTDLKDANGKDKAIINSAKVATQYDDSWNKFVDPAFLGSAEVRTKVDNLLMNVLAGGTEINKAIEETYKKLPAFERG